MIILNSERLWLSFGRKARFASASRNLAEVPKCVKRSFSAKSNSIFALRANGEPS